MTPKPLFAYVDGIGLRGPGLAGWSGSIDLLAGRGPHIAGPTVLVAPAALPPAERRRVGKGVKIALEVGFEAVRNAGRDAASLASVFTSSSGDGDNCDAICRELADERLISPTRFHNSVHNAPSGYWGIASGAMAPSTSLCAFNASFVAGLDDALAQLADDVDAVLLVAYDAPYPEPLFSARPTPDSFGVALVLSRSPSARTLARIDLDAGSPTVFTGAATRCALPTLEHCRRHIPAARALPLLTAIASRDRAAREAIVVLDGTAAGQCAIRVGDGSLAALDTRRTACA